jgi:hypothetical protein
MLVEALQARLKILEEEIQRLTDLASRTPEKDQQENHWLMAQDLQREARDLRSQIMKTSTSADEDCRPAS